MAQANQPVQKFRIGNVSASVWQNDAGFYSVTIQRAYKDAGEWRNTDNLQHGDLTNAIKVLERAENFIAQQSQ